MTQFEFQLELDKARLEQKALDDAERKNLIEKVIWLIEDSYPDTNLWGHDELVNNITKDFERRADELSKMFDPPL